MWWIIAVAIIALVVVVLLLIWFTGAGGKAFGEVGTKISSLGDCDKDGAADMFDKCPCDSSIGDSFPSGTTVCPKVCTGNKDTDCAK